MDKYEIINASRHGLYSVPNQEVLLSFNNDDDAYKFIEWFESNSDDFEFYVDHFFGGK